MFPGRRCNPIVASVCCGAVLVAASPARATEVDEDRARLPGIPGGPALVPGETPEETYQLNFVGLQHVETGGYRNGVQVSKTESWWGFRGKYRVKLGPVGFYEAVARP